MFCAADHHPLGLLLQPVFSPWHRLPPQLVYEDLTGDGVNNLTEVQVDIIQCSPLIPTVERGEMMVFPCCWQWRWPTRCHFFPTLFPAPLSFPSLGRYLGVSVGIHQGFYGEGSSKLLSPVTWRTQSLPHSLSSHCYMAGTGLVSRQATAKVCRYFLQEGQVMGGRQTTDVREDRQFT